VAVAERAEVRDVLVTAVTAVSVETRERTEVATADVETADVETRAMVLVE
jgi:hypothetical protein